MGTHTSTSSQTAQFERQAGTLAAAYPWAADAVTRLRDVAAELPPAADPQRLPFVVVVAAPLAQALALVDLTDRPGATQMTPDELATFRPIAQVDLPAAPAYLAVDVDLGAGSRNVTPDDALPAILAEGRSPLTIDEGVAVLLHHPEVLRTHNAFSLLGSRCGDRRVPALWLSKRRPRLGWCWAGNPHTWLGSASCGARLAP